MPSIEVWNEKARRLFVGRTVKSASYLTKTEAVAMGWEGAGLPLALEFDNGLVVFPSQDDEGNGPGALFTSDEQTPGFPVARPR